jgi:PAS domain-containing protein
MKKTLEQSINKSRLAGGRVAVAQPDRELPTPGVRIHDGHASRRRILTVVQADPGIHVTQIAERTALSWHTTLYHLRILKRAGQVDVHKDGRDRAVFPKGVPVRQRRWVVALRDDQARKVLRILMTSAQNVPAMSRQLGSTEKVVRCRLRSLVKAGLLRQRGRWRPLYEVPRADAGPIATLLAGLEGRQPRPLVGSWEWDVEKDQAVLSPGGWRILGLTPKPARPSKTFLRLVDAKDRARFAAMLGDASNGCASFENTVRVRTKAGVRYLRHEGRVVSRDAAGRAILFQGTIEDVTQLIAFGRSLWPAPGSMEGGRSMEAGRGMDTDPGVSEVAPHGTRVGGGLVGSAVGT